MAVAAPARRSDLQTAPGPSRTAPPPEPKKRPRDRPRPGGQGRSSAAAPTALRKEAAPKRKSAGRKGAATRASAAPAAPARKKAATAAPKRKAAARAAAAPPARKAAPQCKKATSRASSASAAPARKPSRDGLRTAPSRHKAAPRRRPRVGPLAAGASRHAVGAAVAVTQLPESGLIHRLTRGRAWIGVLGVLLVGIVALNVVTLSFAASAGKVEARNLELSKENSMMQGLEAEKYGQARMRHEATELGLAPATEIEPQVITARKTDVAEAAARLAAAEAAQANPE